MQKHSGFHVSSRMLHNWLLACCWIWPRFRLGRCKSSRTLASKHRWCQQVPANQSSRSLTVGYCHVISEATANIHQNAKSLQNVQIKIPLKPKWKPFSQLVRSECLLYLWLWCNRNLSDAASRSVNRMASTSCSSCCIRAWNKLQQTGHMVRSESCLHVSTWSLVVTWHQLTFA